jgi:hypothetical protein
MGTSEIFKKCFGNLIERGHFEDFCIDKGIMLNCNFKKLMGGCGMDSSGSG